MICIIRLCLRRHPSIRILTSFDRYLEMPQAFVIVGSGVSLARVTHVITPIIASFVKLITLIINILTAFVSLPDYVLFISHAWIHSRSETRIITWIKGWHKGRAGPAMQRRLVDGVIGDVVFLVLLIEWWL